MISTMRPLSVLFLFGCALSAQSPAPAGCHIGNGEINGWKSVEMSNPWVKLEIVPQLGGRLMQVTFAGHDFLFVNSQLKGQTFGPEESAAQHKWFNYGGDKIWPMPEGNDDEVHWAGAEGAVLDSGAFHLEILHQDATCAVRLTGPPDPAIGQQYIRDISIGADSPAISFHAVMKNVSGYPQSWSEQSVSQYNTADPQNPAQPNGDIWGITPANPRSVYLDGYHVRTGNASPRGYGVRDGLFSVRAAQAGGEVWVDSPGEWLAVVDAATQFTMVERFRYEKTADYPGLATVIFYTTGNSRRGPAPPDSRPAIHYMEAEVNSPVMRLDPGETYAMDTQWFPTRMGSDFTTAAYAGVAGKPLAAAMANDGIAISGEFGVFFAGQLELRFYGRGGARQGSTNLQAAAPDALINLQKTVQAPADTIRVSLHLIDAHGVDRGPLGETTVSGVPADRN
jgi:hypothetical protein